MLYQTCVRLAVVLALGAAMLATAACSGGEKTNAPVATPTPVTEAMREKGALPTEKAAPIPKGLRCNGAIVWVNLNRKTYHEPADPYYGKTKNGEYMCQAEANAKGYHLAGMRHKGMKGGATQMQMPAPSST